MSLRILLPKYTFIIFIIFLLFPLCSIAAGGYEKPALWSAHGMALGGAMTAHTKGAEALAFNPAGLSGNEFSLHLAGLDGISRSPVVPDQSEEVSSSAPVLAGGLLYSRTLSEKTNLGAGLYGLGGNDVTHPTPHFKAVDSNFAGLKKNEYGKLTAIELSVGASHQVNPKLKIGAALRFIQASGAFSQTQVSLARNLGGFGIPDGTALAASNVEIRDIKGSHVGGIRLGFQYEWHERLKLGVSYRSRANLALKGDASGQIRYSAAGAGATGATAGQGYELRGGSTRVESSFPQSLSTGVAYQLENNWVTHLEHTWTEYAANRSLKLDGSLENTATNDTIVLADTPQRWQSMHDFKAGLTIPREDFEWRLGYTYTTAVSSKNFTGTTAAAPGPYHHLGAGFGAPIRFLRQAWLDVGAEFYYGEGKGQTAKSVSSTSEAARAQGTWRTQAWALALALKWQL